MKRLFFILAGWLLAAPLFAQPQPVLTPPSYASLPATCSVGSLVTKTTATAGLYVCSAANTWTIVTSGGSGAPTDATYITQTANSSLSAEQALGALSTGLMNSATTTGIVSTLAPTDDNTVVGSGTAWALKALPSCSAGSSALSYNTTTNAFGCNTISSGTPASPTTSVQFNNAGSFGGDASFIENVTALATPADPGLVKVGAGTGTTWGYQIVAKNLVGSSEASNEATISGNATLDGTHSITITPPACAGGAIGYDIWRTTGGAYGLIAANQACSTPLSDTGLTPIPGLLTQTGPLNGNSSVGVGSNAAYINTSTGSAFGSAAFANNNSVFVTSDTGTGLSVLQDTSDPTFGYNTFLVDTFVTTNTVPVSATFDVEVFTDTISQAGGFMEAAAAQVIDHGHPTTTRAIATVYADTQLSGVLTTNFVTTYYAAPAITAHALTTPLASFYSDPHVNFGGSASEVYGAYLKAPTLSGGTPGTISTYIGAWQEALSNVATNGYSFWHDAQGVFRIKEDNTFNSVYQAIPALYNPQYAKYTPGTPFFERVVLGQFNSNVAEFGTEKGAAVTLTSVTSAATTATATLVGMNPVTGSVVTIAGANQTEYNGSYTITRVNNDSFTYPFAGSATTPATGTITAQGGTQRAVRVLGANLSVTSSLTPAVTDTSADSCGSGTQTIAGNDNAGKVTVIGSGGTSCTVTFATAFANAPSCSATNETTAALARATSTTSTVILAGVFLQNDVIAYTCIGR